MVDEKAAKVSQEELDAQALQKDVEGFNAELIPILGKYSVGLGATAFITPDGRIGARPIVFRAPAAAKSDTPADAPAPAAEAPAVPGNAPAATAADA